ncbi:hypothetical protein LP420_34570 [Massilia sp. B-10]|nr:hypothetical protein LP420_34570 [Massilia sp. B-10]
MRAERHRETFDVGLKSFINEARFLAQFDHPSLVKVYRFWEQNHTAYTAMQYYEGRTIKDIVNGSPHVVNEAWCRKILKQILDARDAVHDAHPAPRRLARQHHRPGKRRRGPARLRLGAPDHRRPHARPDRDPQARLCAGRAVSGDASLDQGAYTDIYALSAVVYFAICKEPQPTSIARMVKDPMLPLAERGIEGYSREFLSAIDKGLAVLASDRPQTIDAFRELLGIASSGVPRASGRRHPALCRHQPDPAPACGHQHRHRAGTRAQALELRLALRFQLAFEFQFRFQLALRLGLGLRGRRHGHAGKAGHPESGSHAARACTHRRRAGCRTWRWAWPWWSFLASA